MNLKNSILLACLFLSACKTSNIPIAENAKPPVVVQKTSAFELRFLQHGIEVPYTEKTVFLDKAPFSIVLILEDIEGVYVNASLNYHNKYDTDNFDDMEIVDMKVMAEELLNPSKSILLDSDSYSYWYFDGTNEMRVNSAIEINGKTILTKEIHKQINLLDDEEIYCADARQDLFLLFFTRKLSGELAQRKYLKVAWND